MDRETSEKIIQSAFLPVEEQRKLQQELLTEQAGKWLSETSYFKQRLNEAGIFAPEDLKLDILHTLPTCSKADVSAHYAQMIPEGIRVADFCTTSGSTGNPVTIPLTLADIGRLGLNEAVSYLSAGVTENDILMLCTTVDRTFMAGLAYVEGARKLQVPMVRAGIGNPAVHWDYILRFGVTALIAVPSYILKLMAYATENNIPPGDSSVKKIICIGESLRDAENNDTPVAKKIKDGWNVGLFSTYASTEMQTAFTECEHHNGGHHVPGLIIAEFLDEDGNAVKEGTAGELTITHLGVEGMPLLRFRTGDICLHSEAACACGRKSLRIQTVVSRKNEMLKFKGTTVFPSVIIESLNSKNDILDFVVVAENDEHGHDLISIHVSSGTGAEHWKTEVEALIRVKPVWHSVSKEKIETLRQLRPSRKLLKFIDLR